ncbi:MAG: redoxin domain-containing protein [Calditrichia bacterium]|nr:redoxin domain-containing protein [Calditrichia bacterium]
MSLKNSTKIVIFASLLLIFSLNSARAAYAVGDTVTNFTLNDVHGNPISLNNYQGEVILLNFFATW